MKQSLISEWSDAGVPEGALEQTVFETSDGNFLVHFYKIEEYGMMRFCSPVKIWRDKSAPKLVMDSVPIAFEYQFSRSVEYLSGSQVVCLLFPEISNTRIDYINVLIDIAKSEFATIRTLNFDLIEGLGRVIQLKLNPRYSYSEEELRQLSKREGERIELNKLDWMPLSKLGRLP